MRELLSDIKKGRILKKNGSWMYCEKCNKTVGYLCYTTYQDFQFDFVCKCGNIGSFRLFYKIEEKPVQSNEKLKLNKNRLCCPNDNSPLFSIVEKNIEKVKYSITCKKCLSKFTN